MSVIWLIYVSTPILDKLLPIDQYNLSKKQVAAFEKDSRFLIPLYIYWALDFISYFWALYTFTYCEFNGILDQLILIFVTAHIGGVALAIGHELLHRKQTIHKITGTLIYSKALYSHFFIEHIKGHHKNVATPLDPATAVIGENVYKFIFKSIIGGYKSVWNYEVERLSKKTLPESPFSLNNRMISYNIAHLIYLILIYYFMGYRALIYALNYSLVVIIFQEAINYVEHYGLSRKKDESGIYEPISLKHSWNSPHRYSNYILFKLQRHSDHHANSYKPYQILDSFSKSPTLFGGYPLALLTALCPPVMYKVYSPLALAATEDRKLQSEELSRLESLSSKYFISVSSLITIACFLLS